MNKKIKYRTWEDHMQDVLSDPECARTYLLGSIEDYLKDHDLDFSSECSLCRGCSDWNRAVGYSF